MSLKVILVDDHNLSLVSMRNFLRSIGFEVHAFVSPLDAQEVSCNNNYDLIVSDFHMPHINGIELIQDIRSHQPHIKSILLTGYCTDKTKEEASHAGVDLLMTKPVQISEFIRLVDEMFPD